MAPPHPAEDRPVDPDPAPADRMVVRWQPDHAQLLYSFLRGRPGQALTFAAVHQARGGDWLLTLSSIGRLIDQHRLRVTWHAGVRAYEAMSPRAWHQHRCPDCLAITDCWARPCDRPEHLPCEPPCPERRADERDND
jgi:hypothetical protein